MINEKELIKHLTKLVSFRTIEGNLVEQKKCLAYIKEQFSFYPFVIAEYESNGKPSLVLTTEKTKHPEMFLVAHIDVVPGHDSLFTLKKEGDSIFGRGAFDMKFAIATYICVLKEIYQQKKKLPSIGLMFTSEEEIEGNNGAGFLLQKKGYSCNLAFLPDGGDNWHIVEEEKGILNIKLTVTGKTAHGAMPWIGENAITKLFAIGAKLQTMYPSSSDTSEVTLNFGKITGGEALNQVAQYASLLIDIRFASKPAEKIVHEIQKAFPDSKIEVFDLLPTFKTAKNNLYIQKWAQLIKAKNKNNLFIKEHAASDAPFFSEKNIPVILSKPQGEGSHGENEYIILSSWLEFSKIFKKFLTS